MSFSHIAGTRTQAGWVEAKDEDETISTMKTYEFNWRTVAGKKYSEVKQFASEDDAKAYATGYRITGPLHSEHLSRISMNTSAKNALAELYIHNSPTISAAEAMDRVKSIASSNAYQANGLDGLSQSTRETLEALLAYIGANSSKSSAAVALGRLGGQVGGKVKSDAKSAAARANGAKGGRPVIMVTSTSGWHHMPDHADRPDLTGQTMRQAIRSLRAVDFGDIGGCSTIELSDGTWLEVANVRASGGCQLMGVHEIRRMDRGEIVARYKV